MEQHEAPAELLTVETVAAILGVSDNWLYSAVRRREIESVRVGVQIRFRSEAIEDYIDTHTRTAA